MVGGAKAADIRSAVYGDDLTDAQLKMVIESGEHRDGHDGYGVELRGANWRVARALVAYGLGSIEGDPGGELPGLYFNNSEGVSILHEHDDLIDEEEWCA